MTDAQTIEQAEADFAETSKALGRLIAEDGPQAEIKKARKQRDEANQTIEDIKLAREAQQEAKREAEASAEAEQREQARQDMEEALSEIERAGSDVTVALADAGRAYTDMQDATKRLADAAVRAGVKGRALRQDHLLETLKGRLADTLSEMNIQPLPVGAKPKANLAAFVSPLKLAVAHAIREEDKEAA